MALQYSFVQEFVSVQNEPVGHCPGPSKSSRTGTVISPRMLLQIKSDCNKTRLNLMEAPIVA